MQDINNKQNIQLAKLEERIKAVEIVLRALDTKITLISVNCIPTLTKEVAKMDANQKILMAFMFAVVAALIGLYFK